MGVPGPAFAGGAVGGERDLIVLDASDMLHHAFAISGPGIDAEGEVSSQSGHLRLLLPHSAAHPLRRSRLLRASLAL